MNVQRGASDLARFGSGRGRGERAGAQPHDRRHALQFDHGLRLTAIDLTADAQRFPFNPHFYAIAYGTAAKPVSEARRNLLTVSVAREQHDARRQLAAQTQERTQASLRLVLSQLGLIGDDHRIAEARDLQCERVRTSADDDGAQPPAQLVGEASPGARESLRGFVKTGGGEETDSNVVH